MILCSGEALIDMIPFPTTAPAAAGRDGFVPFAGGAVFNTAVALGRLGAPTGMLTGLSRDVFGQQLEQVLTESAVSSDLCVRSDRFTTLAFVRLENGQATYDFHDENTAGRMLTPDDMPALDARVTALFLGGISLMIEPCAEAYRALLAREGGTRAVMLDPNIRPDFIRDPARYRDRLTAMLAQSDIVKVSDEDLDWILPGDTPAEARLAQLFDLGPSLVVMTKGDKGATGYMRDGRSVTVPARAVQVVDTIGAGDTFNAGLLASLSQQGLLTKSALRDLSDAALEQALDLGVRTAAVTVSRAGANPPWPQDL